MCSVFQIVSETSSFCYNIRNVAIIAHVDHGKTTLVDQLLRQSGQFRHNELAGECILDSNPLERERGITILAKNCSIDYTDRNGEHFRINIIDTPGHADFSGEVERVLKMADGVLLLVDAFEGVMPQTRYVLSKALAIGLTPIVVINKMDRSDASPNQVLNQVFDLLVDLDADDYALDFPTIYASAREGWATTEQNNRPKDANIHALFDAIIQHVPVPAHNQTAPLQALITTLDYNEYTGRIGIGRVFAGTLKSGQDIALVNRNSNGTRQRIGQLLRFEGLGRKEVDHIDAGDLFAVVGLEKFEIGDTIADPDQPTPLPSVPLDEPTLHMIFRINDGPFTGKEGRYVTNRQIGERLQRELKSNISLRMESRDDEFLVSGRGLLHLSILLENMRREGYELAVGKPQVICRHENGQTLEPIELLVIDVPAVIMGTILELLGDRRAIMVRMDNRGSRVHMEFEIPARGIIGLRSRLLMATQGEAIIHHRFHEYALWRGEIQGRTNGVMIATHTGQVTTYALGQLADRGTMFVKPSEQVYEGQIVGEHSKQRDIPVNVIRPKPMTNMRASTKDETVSLKAPKSLTLETALEYIEDDELVEITPASIRMRKYRLKEIDRRRQIRKLAASQSQ